MYEGYLELGRHSKEKGRGFLENKPAKKKHRTSSRAVTGTSSRRATKKREQQ